VERQQRRLEPSELAGTRFLRESFFKMENRESQRGIYRRGKQQHEDAAAPMARPKPSVNMFLAAPTIHEVLSRLWLLPVFCLCQKSHPVWSKMELKWLRCALIPGEKQSNA